MDRDQLHANNGRMNAMMAIPNLIALIMLSGVVVAETRQYLWEGNLDATAPESSGNSLEESEEDFKAQQEA